MMKNSITVMIPIHELKEAHESMLKDALLSIKEQVVAPEKIMLVLPSGGGMTKKIFTVAKEVGYGKKDLTIVHNDGNTNFQSQLNVGVENLETTHFTFLEFDDEFSDIWIKNVKEYLTHFEDVGLFLPLILNKDKEKRVVGMTNEPVWANDFSDEMGYLDVETLKRYNDFNFDGMVMSKETYQSIGGLKTTMKSVFPLEFLLRACEYSRVMIIPKIGYYHTVMREGSLFDTIKNEMSVDEQRWWLALSKKEYFHKKDREITYERED